MINKIQYEAAATYLNQQYQYSQYVASKKENRKVEKTEKSKNEKRFNKDAADKANFQQHIDICI